MRDEYFQRYDGLRSYADSIDVMFDEGYTIDMIAVALGLRPPYRLLDCGSASGLTLPRLARLGVDAWGVEYSRYIHAQTAPEWLHRNLLGDVRALPFADASFDVVYDTCLPHVPPEDLDRASGELFRVARVGVFYGGVGPSMTPDVISRHHLLDDVCSALTLPEWGERFLRAGFEYAVEDADTLGRLWQLEQCYNQGGPTWYPSAASMRYCFYRKPK